ncbi:chemotaxis protein CheW [Piscinibacter sp. HJYY11]|uniref:chemotaxis protein CheW n=1 Tax=Piscinibacter sp. HJYY11 TaxID=2801333 RepID=UPI00191E7E45|nr:chemotaxis protein CheW [Piscinibacter sp. HJYY11]MBL0728521.1 purine-binding chemotaxis protein CheW [Piscinibacter sp. HJYY11]
MSAIVEVEAKAVAAAARKAAEPGQYLTFVLGGEAYAIGILAIKEIIEYHDLTEVPMMPPCVRGVINLRGAVVPVVDLQARFGRRASEVTKRTCIVIVEVATQDERQVIGVVVDAVSEVLEIEASAIEPAPSFGAGIRTDFIQGMGKVRGKFVILLNVDHVLDLEEVAGLQRAVDAVAEAS